jgi:hypothetical protein
MTRKMLGMVAFLVVFCTGYVAGQQKAATNRTLIHSAAWTSLKDMKPQDLEAFKTVVGSMIGKVPGLKTAWVGKLQKPLTVDGVTRDYGIVLEFADEPTWNKYVAKRPQEFEDAFAKIRIPGSTNFNTMGW